MKLRLRITVDGLGKDGETVTVADNAQAQWLLDGGYAIKEADAPTPAPAPVPAKKATAPRVKARAGK